MSQKVTNKLRCDILNIDAHAFNNRSGSHILVYVDIPDVEDLSTKKLIVEQILLQSVKDEFSETYEDLEIEYFSYHNSITLCIYPTKISEELCIDLTEHIINIIQSINNDNLHEDMIEIKYYRSLIMTTIN